jgi:hypothetical protein
MRTLLSTITASILLASPVLAAGDDYNSSRSNNTTATTDAGDTDPVVRKKPGRTSYGDVTLKRGVVDEPAPQPTQIDPPSMQLDAGPADTSTTEAKAKKPKEIVVVGSKAKGDAKPKGESSSMDTAAPVRESRPTE